MHIRLYYNVVIYNIIIIMRQGLWYKTIKMYFHIWRPNYYYSFRSSISLAFVFIGCILFFFFFSFFLIITSYHCFLIIYVLLVSYIRRTIVSITLFKIENWNWNNCKSWSDNNIWGANRYSASKNDELAGKWWTWKHNQTR